MNNTTRVTLHLFAMTLLKNILFCPTRAVTQRSLKGEFDLQISTPNFGACINNIGLTCSIGPFNCQSNNKYIKPSAIDTGLCHSPHQVETGRCASSSSMDLELKNNVCAAFPTSCTTPLYSEIDNTCSIVVDKSTQSNTLTQYPSCREKASSDPASTLRCVLSQDECVEETEDFMSVGDLRYRNKPCSCHDVPTGICYASSSSATITTSTSLCAVAKYDCPAGYNFMTALKLSTMVDPPRICRLCQQEDGYYNTIGGSEFLEEDRNIEDQVNFAYGTPNYDGALGDNNSGDAFGYYDYDDISNDKFSMALVLGGSISGIFVLTTAATFYYIRENPVIDFDVLDKASTDLIISEGTFI